MICDKYTSEWATNVQKAYKEAYKKGQLDTLKQLQDKCAGVYEEYIPEIIDEYIEELEDEPQTL